MPQAGCRTTIWLFRGHLSKAHAVEERFARFDLSLNEAGFRAAKGQIVDASIVSVPVQLGSRRENERIRAGEEPEGWSEARRRQKDVDARWTGKNGKSCFGYTNHIGVDVPHKLTGKYQVSSANVYESQVFEDLSSANTGRDLRADWACRSAERLEWLDRYGYREHVQRKGRRHHPLSSREQQGKCTHFRIRGRVEHIFLAYRPSEPAVCSCVALAR